MPSPVMVSCTAFAGTTTTVSVQDGDFLFVWAFRDGSTTAPTLPTGWTQATNAGANAVSERSGWRRVQGNNASFSIGTWTNASMGVVWVFRNVKRGLLNGAGQSAVRAVQSDGGSSLAVNFASAAFQARDGNSLMFGVAAHASVDTNLETAVPAGFTQTATLVNATCEIVAWRDPNPRATAGGPYLFNLTGTTGGWRSCVFELIPDTKRLLWVN